METRHPAGYGEDASIIGLFGALGSWLATQVGDPQLGAVVTIATTIGGQLAATALRNKCGRPLASVVGAGPMRGAARVLLGCLLAAALGGSSLLLTGCATNAEGERVVERAACLQACDAGGYAAAACPVFLSGPDEPAASNRLHCEAGIRVAVEACRMGCGFAEPGVPGVPPE